MVPEQSAGGSLTQRPPQPRAEHPALGAAGARHDDVTLPPARQPAGPGEAESGPDAGDGQLSDSEARIAAAVEGWRRSLAGSGMPDTLLVCGPQATASWLDLTHCHPSGLAQLFAARPTRLSSLFREPDAHAAAWRQARAIRASATVLSAQRGVQGCCLAIGVASWRSLAPATSGPVQAPVVLRGCAIRPRGAGDDDFDLDLDDAVLINPELIRELVDSYGIEADGGQLAAMAQGAKGFDPRPVYAWLEDRCRALRAFRIERSLVLATFAAGSGGVLADLDAAVPAISAHRLLGQVAAAAGPAVLTLPEASAAEDAPASASASAQASAPASASAPALDEPPTSPAVDGDSRRLTMIGRLGPRGSRPIRPPQEPDPAQELLVVDCDGAQAEAVAAALRGEDVVIEGPPGSGATHTLVAAVAGLVAAGRKVLVLSPRPASTESLLERMRVAGLGDLVLDLRDSVGDRPVPGVTGSVQSLRSSLEQVGRGPLVELPKPGAARLDDAAVQTIRGSRELLDGVAEALHAVRRPWGISCYDTLVALAELTGRPGGPSSGVRLPDDVLTRMDTLARERLRVHLHSAAAAGAFTLTRVDTRWYDAAVRSTGQARTTLEAALVLRAGLERARLAMESVTTAAGLRPATSASGWVPLLNLMLGVRAVVDAMLPQVYEQPLVELAAVLAPRARRGAEPPALLALGRAERRRLRRQAQALVRPGVHVANLYEVLIAADEQRRAWQRLSVTGEGPRAVVGLSEAEAAMQRVTSALDVLAEVFSGTPAPDLRELPLADLERRVFDLAGDAQGILGQPRRARLVDGLGQAGLGPLVDDLRARRVGSERIDAEFDLVWFCSVRDSIVRADPYLARHDSAALRQASADLREAETARIAAGSELVRAAVLGRAAKVALSRPEQVRVLRYELGRQDRRPRMVDLIRRCGDVLSALTPIWMMSADTVAACLAPADPDLPPIVDTVVLDDAGHVGLPEVLAAMARGAQLIVAGDRRRLAPPDGSTSVIESLAPFATVCRLDRDHRARDGRMLVPLAPRYPEGWQLTPGIAATAPLELEVVPDGVAIPPPGEELPLSSDAEVRRVVELVQRHAELRPRESLVVVTVNERHAERIEEALRVRVNDHPLLGRWLAEQWQDGRAEPFVVRSVQRVLGVERDAAIVSVGLARTPHGRVLHQFGVLDGDKGAATLTTAVSRARTRITVVCCFAADDLIVDRLRTAGARLLRDILLAAGGRTTASGGRMSVVTDGLVGDLRDRLDAAGLPVQVRVSDGAWPVDIAVADPRVPGRMLLAVDLDGPAFSSRACRERERARPARWQRAGWVYCKVSAIDVLADPALEVARIRDAWNRAMADPMADPVADPMAAAPLPSGASLPLGLMPGPQDDDQPVLPNRAAEDTDDPWPDPDPDERLREERPPHWD